MRRSFTRTRHPGIFAGALPGKKPDRYQVYYRVRGLGQRSRTFHTLKDALVFEGRARDPLKQRELRELDKGKIPLTEFLGRYVGGKRKWRESTRERYGYAARLILSGRLAQLRVADITREDVNGWIEEMIGGGVRPGAYEKAFSLLRSDLREAVEEGLAVRNPSLGVELPERVKREAFALTPHQVACIAEEVPPRHRALVYLLGFLGLRIGEASALQVRDLDLERGVLHVRRNSPEVGGRKIIGEPKSARGRRDIHLRGWFVELLSDHLERFGPRSDSGQLDQFGFVFTHRQGGQIR